MENPEIRTRDELLIEISLLRKKIAKQAKIESEYKQKEKILKDSEERYKGIIQNTASCVVIYKPTDNGQNFIIVDFNQMAEKTEQISKDKVIGKKVTEVFPGVIDFGLFKVFQNVCKSGKPEYFPVSIYQDDRIKGYRENYVYKLSSGEIVAVYQDLTERKAKEDELKSLSYMVEQSTEGMGLADLTGKMIFSNMAWCIMHGYMNPKDYLGKNLAIFHNKEQLKNEVILFNEEVKKYGTYSGEVGHITKDGKVFTTLMTSTLLKDTNGEPFAIVGIAKDITDRKQVESELIRLQALHGETEKTAKIGGWTFDIETMNQTWTDEVFRILEIDLSKGAPKVPEGIAFIDPPYRQMAELAIQKSIENGESYDQEWIVTTFKGNKRWVHVLACPLVEKGKTIKISGSFQDITDRKQAEYKLIQSEQKFKMLVTNIEEIIYLVDKDGIFTVSEGKGLEKLGLKPGQVVGISVLEFYKDYPDILVGIRKALNGETTSMEVQVGPNYFTNWITPQFNLEDEVIGLIGLAINITDRKKAEEELKKHHDHLEEIVKERTKDLETKNKELDNAMKVFVGRELTIQNLKERIRALEGK